MMQSPIIQAWIYPGNPACSATTEMADGRHIDVLKPQYFQLSDSGSLLQQNASDPSTGCNGYSLANIATIKKYSSQQFVTISGTQVGMATLIASGTLTAAYITTMLSFLQANALTGIELDWEPFTNWTSTQYESFKAFVIQLGNALHSHGFKLMLDGPAIINSTYQGYYLWKYEDFDSLPVDFLVMMCYDFQYDTGAGTPVAPLSAITSACSWMKSKITDPSRIVIGLNSYGYHGKSGSYMMTIDTYQQSLRQPGMATATRDTASGEMMWAAGGIIYNYSDSITLNRKVQTVLASGLSAVSIWHLGGNEWPSLPMMVSPPTSVSSSSPGDPVLAAFTTAFPGFQRWYSQHFDANGNYIP